MHLMVLCSIVWRWVCSCNLAIWGCPMGSQYIQTALSQIQERSTNPQPPALPVNIRERPIRNVPEPATNKPTDAEFYLRDDQGELKANPNFLKDHFFREGRLTEAQALFILENATIALSKEENLVSVKSPVTICGDIHGQYYDLMKLFDVGGNLNDNCYLFLGDYVDRGCFGIECLLYLYSLKLWYPSKFYFTFKRECLHKYSPLVYEACVRSFRALPLTALVDGRFFCLIKLSDLNRIDRFQEPGSHGLLCDLLWSDPIANFGHEQEPSSHGPGLPVGTTFLHNQTRGCSFYFTYEAACQFLERNGLLGIIRGHEAQDAGYTMHRKTPTKKFPSVITIFSAPNYLDAYHNRAAVIKYANKNITIRQYNYSPHPYWLPNFMDAFTWSLPFVGAKITEMLLAILSICSEEELIESDSESDGAQTSIIPQSDIQLRRQQIKNKIRAVGRMQRVFQLLREESESASELMADEGSGATLAGPRITADALGVQGHQIKRGIHSFDDARRSDLLNERLPEFDPGHLPGMFPVPSMRARSRGRSESDGMNMEYLIKKTLDDDDDEEGGVVERLAEKIARGRAIAERPSALKRHGTA
ncbi:Metallo-dependent phosphatase-like protein [Infundibulicybe gibba]|nr:Metallo-dependent phosphatase-like protein [Infundibulicybe gibba]